MSDTGGGHRALSQAIAAGLAEETNGRGRTTIVDPFAGDQSRFPGALMGCYAPLIRRAPRLYGALFDLFDDRDRYRSFVRRIAGSIVERIVQHVAQERPDVVVFAHSLAVTPGLDAIEQLPGMSRLPTVAMVTELATVHWSWIDDRSTRYLVASEEVQKSVVHRGIAAARVSRTGLPVGPRFGRVTEPPETVRCRLRLSPRRTTALVLGGGEGSGPVEELVLRLADALPELQIVVVCGRNESLMRRLDSRCLPPTVRLFGFVENMAELMHAADFVLTKGGPQTVAEALAAGRPVVITNLLPGQEKGNGAYVARHGAGYVAPTVADMIAAARRLFDDLRKREALADAARAIGPRDAARAVARELLAIGSPG